MLADGADPCDDLTIWEGEGEGECSFNNTAFSTGIGFVCSEESFRLRFELGQYICLHEIAHSIEIAGLLDGSEWTEAGRRIRERAASPEVQEIWHGSYAIAHGDREFFAVVSQSYFYANTWLYENDPVTYELIHAVYRGFTALSR